MCVCGGGVGSGEGAVPVGWGSGWMQSSYIAPDAWFQYFKGLMNAKDVNESSIPEGTCASPSFVNELSEPITLKEVKTGTKA